MYRIIMLSMSVDDTLFDGHSFRMLQESFSTKEEAHEFIEARIQETNNEASDGTWGSTEFNVENYDDEYIDECTYEGDIQWRDEYKIVEVR